MPRWLPALVCALGLGPVATFAAGPTVLFTLPAPNTTPAVFGALPFPNDLYFDQGRPGDGDGTLINAGLPSAAKIGLASLVIQSNTASVEEALDLLDGFGTTSAIYFFFSGAIDPASLPPSPVLAPALTDSVFCADAATATPVPIMLKWNADSRIPNVLAVLPVPGRPLAARTRYACVVRTSVTGGGMTAVPSADWTSVRDGASATADADAIFDPVVTTLGGHGVAASAIAGMTVFTTQSTVDDLVRIRDEVLPGLPVPTVTVPTWGPQPYGQFVSYTAGQLNELFGSTPHEGIIAVLTGWFPSPRFQTLDPNGSGPFADIPDPPGFVTCSLAACETTDERFTRDGSGRPMVVTMQNIPVTVVMPFALELPPGGFPIVIQMHGLGGQRDTVLEYANELGKRGFASIGIDAAQHGYRYFDCPMNTPCAQDTANNFGGTRVPDGFADGAVGPFSIGYLSTNLGFFQGFHNFLGVRDNLRQTYVDLMQLVRLIKGHSLDQWLGTLFNDQRIYFMGHSLGGLMGAGFVPIERQLSASVLNAGGGGLITQLFQNSSVGGGNQALVNGILGLDPANVADQFAIAPNLIQTIVDPADGVNAASLLLNDVPARNVLLIESTGDEVVPNQASEALAVAAGLPVFDPFVRNPRHNPIALPVVPTPRTVRANVAGGTATAAFLQSGPASHAAVMRADPGTLTLAPDVGLYDEFPVTGTAFPPLARPIRVPNPGLLDEVLAWFRDIVTNGTPGRFSFADDPNYNPVENRTAPAGASTQTFFARTVSTGGAAPFSEPTPDVTVAFANNAVATRVTVGRAILGTSAFATEDDVAPGELATIGTLGILPFHVTLQRELAGVFSADLSLGYSVTELGVAGIAPGSPEEAALVVASFTPGACTLGAAACDEDPDCGANGPCAGATYTLLPTTVSTATHTVTTPGVTAFSTFAVLHPDMFTGGFVPPLVPGGGATRYDCHAQWQVIDPTNTPFRDVAGRLSRKQDCRDGDPACDADRTPDGVCTYRLGVCFNRAEATLPDCPAGGDPVTSYTLLAPTPVSRNATDVANAQTLLDALVALGGVQGGVRQNEVTFTTPIDYGPCTALGQVQVPLRGSGRPGRKNVRGVALLGSGARDVDRLRLGCQPAS